MELGSGGFGVGSMFLQEERQCSMAEKNESESLADERRVGTEVA